MIPTLIGVYADKDFSPAVQENVLCVHQLVQLVQTVQVVPHVLQVLFEWVIHVHAQLEHFLLILQPDIARAVNKVVYNATQQELVSNVFHPIN